MVAEFVELFKDGVEIHLAAIFEQKDETDVFVFFGEVIGLIVVLEGIELDLIGGSCHRKGLLEFHRDERVLAVDKKMHLAKGARVHRHEFLPEQNSCYKLSVFKMIALSWMRFLATMIFRGEIMFLKQGEVLIHEGEKSNQLFWLMTGELVVVKKLQDHEVVLNQIKEGELVGELSFLDQKPRSATVKAVKDCQLYVLEYSEYQAMLAKEPKWMKKILLTLVTKVRKLSEI